MRFTLTIVTVLALPIDIVAGLLGLHVGGIPLVQDAHGFHILVGTIVSFTFLAAWFAFRRRVNRLLARARGLGHGIRCALVMNASLEVSKLTGCS
jgi:hypothetical protein